MSRLHRHLTVMGFHSQALLDEVLRAGLEREFLVVRLGPQIVAVPPSDLEAVEQYLLKKGYYPLRKAGDGGGK